MSLNSSLRRLQPRQDPQRIAAVDRRQIAAAHAKLSPSAPPAAFAFHLRIANLNFKEF
jgi:hypothetical protein